MRELISFLLLRLFFLVFFFFSLFVSIPARPAQVSQIILQSISRPLIDSAPGPTRGQSQQSAPITPTFPTETPNDRSQEAAR